MASSRKCLDIAHGIYSCQWKSEYRPYETRLREKFFWWLLFFICILSFSWFFCWCVFSNDYNDFEWFLYQHTGAFFAWATVILVVFAIFTFYVSLLFVTGIVLIANRESRHLHLGHKIAILVVGILCIAAYALISKLWGEEYDTAVLAWQMMGPWIHIMILVSVTSASWLMFWEIMQMEKRWLMVMCNIGMFLLMIGVCLIPLSVHSPCLTNDVHSFTKPLLIGHRAGYPEKAPENTILSYTLANSTCDLFGIESDVTISWDGVPFLMHDATLERTTNVKEIFSNRSDHLADTFTWKELQQLDAGSWFLKEDPFHTVKSISENFKNEIKHQKIPTLTELTTLAGSSNRSFIFDLRRPHFGHPYYSEYLNLTIKTLLDSGMRQNLVLWLPGTNRLEVHEDVPGFRLVGTNEPIPYLLYYDVFIVNMQYNLLTMEDVKAYQNNNISIIQYVISSPWVFSVAWCEGTTYTTTNNCEKLKQMSKPAWTLTHKQYLAIWLSCDFVAFAIFIVIFYVHVRQLFLNDPSRNYLV